MVAKPVSIDEIKDARARLAGVAVRTPLLRFPPDSGAPMTKIDAIERLGGEIIRVPFDA